MKKVIYFAVVASVAFASCTKNEVRTVEDNQDRQITFQAVVHKASTKALLNTTLYPSDGPSFGTFAYLGTSTYINNAEVKNTTNATSGDAWTTDPAYYWPKQGSLTFMSYSPYSICSGDNVACDISSSASDPGIVIKKWDVDAHQTVDVMIADRIDDQRANGTNGGWNGVPTVFRHKLAQVVDFKLKTDKQYAITAAGGTDNKVGSKQFFVNEIGIYFVKHEARFVSGNGPSNTSIGAWSEWTDSYLSYNWYYNENNGPVNEFTYTDAGTTCHKNGKYPNPEMGDYYDINRNGYLLVMPQNFTGSPLVNSSTPPANTPCIKFVYTIRTWWGNELENPNNFTDEEVTVYQTLAAIHGSTDANPKGWEINKRYTYTISVGLDQIYWAPSVENWENESAGQITF